MSMSKVKRQSRFYTCKCDCGTIKDVNGASLSIGGTKSCGCLIAEVTAKRNRENRKYPEGTNYAKMNSETLSDYYVASQIAKRTSLVATEIPNSLIEVKREYLKLGRKLKGIKDENNERSKRKIG